MGCGASFHRSPITWDILPLVEFELEEGIGEEEALVSRYNRSIDQSDVRKLTAARYAWVLQLG